MSQARPVRVGLVGASPTMSWASMAHLPALAALPELSLTAVATTRDESARAAADAFGVQHAFASAGDLVNCDDVDLVVVSVKVPEHARILDAALSAGKHVYCEWPLGVSSQEAERLTAAAVSAGVVHAVGLQGRVAAGTLFVRQLIEEGRIGDVEAVTAIAYAGMNGSRVAPSLEWATDPAAGVNNLSVSGGHVLATLAGIVGDLTSVSALLHNRNKSIEIGDTGRVVKDPPPSQVVISGLTEVGCAVSIVVQGGNPPTASGFLISIIGTDGRLIIRPAQGAGSLWIVDWEVELVTARGGTVILTPPARAHGPAAGPAANVSQVYLEVATAISENRDSKVNFRTALQYHRALDVVSEAARSGARLRMAQLDDSFHE